MKYIKTTLIILAILGIVFVFGGYKENFDFRIKKNKQLFLDSFIENYDSSDEDDTEDTGKKLFDKHVRIQKQRQQQLLSQKKKENKQHKKRQQEHQQHIQRRKRHHN